MRGHHRRGVGATLAVGFLLLTGCQGEVSSQRDEVSDPAAAVGAAPPAPSEDDLTLAFAGDVHFEGGLTGLVGRPDATLGAMSTVLRGADLAVLNLEGALTTRGAPAAKELEDPGNRYWFRSPPAALGVLERSGVDVVSVANNHGADHGVPGLRDTVRAGAQSPVAVIGAGLDEAAAFAPYRVSVKGTDVAVLAADASPLESNDPTWQVVSGSGPGLASARGEAAQLVAAVRASAAVDDLVVVYLHWGEEGVGCPTGGQESLARALSEAGADVVVGSHAHVAQGAGTLPDGAYVAYGLGNFFWYHGNTSETGVLELTVRDGGVVDDEWVPARIRSGGGNPQPLAGTAASEAVSDWRDLRGCTDLAPGPGAVTDGLPAYAADVAPIGRALAAKMRSHDAARCPLPLSDLRRLSLTYVGFDGQAHDGALVVHQDVAEDVAVVFGSLYEARFPIRRMRLIDVYGGDDDRSMAANNTSAYNCRRVAGSTSWSDHAYGRAVDINPLQNPYVVGTDVRPNAGRRFVDAERSAGMPSAPGVITDGGIVTSLFDRLGWTWGGTYSEPDFQHVSLSRP